MRALSLLLIGLLATSCSAFTVAPGLHKRTMVTERASGVTLAEPYPPLSDVELAEQSAKLDALSAKWEKREAQLEYADTMRSGWGPSPERINGRSAMFFIIVGLVTEYYTGQSLPQQVYTMLQTMGIVE